MKRFLRIFGCTVLCLALLAVPVFEAAAIPGKLLDNRLSAKILGIGGGGALFHPGISPHDANEMYTIPDMGGIYVTHDQGLHWDRFNLYGQVISATYDPNTPGVLYAGGAGLYRSTDNGRTFSILFPREDDVIAHSTLNENGLQYWFTRSGNYDGNKYVKDIVVDPTDSQHLLVLSYYGRNGIVYESFDGGENFAKLFTFTKATSGSIFTEFVELAYRTESDEVVVLNDEYIMSYNRTTDTTTKLYESPGKLIDMSVVREGGQTYFVLLESVTGLADTDTIAYYTSDFVSKTDITDAVIAVKPTSFNYRSYGEVTYRYNFNYVSATSLNNIYISNRSYAQTTENGSYPYSIDGIIRYHDGSADYLYGNPFWDHNHLSARSWIDGNTYALGLAASPHDDEEFLFTTLAGVYYAPDNTHIYPRHSTKQADGSFATNGIDEQTTYGILIDPSDSNVMLLLNTDLGMTRSVNGGETWMTTHSGIPSAWQNTSYDAKFDPVQPGVVYSLWSGRHDAPYTPGDELTAHSRHGGFAISYDSGATWDATYSSGLPENSTPLKLQVVRAAGDSEATIYVATFNNGFFVSHDSGRSFTSMNNGITPVASPYGDVILASDIEVTDDGRIFGQTASSTYNGGKQAGQVLEYINGSWQALTLPAQFETPRDIAYNDGVLYVAGVPYGKWDRTFCGGMSFCNVAGGLYAYKDGAFMQLFDDETISTTGIAFDSRGTVFVSDTNGNIYRKEADSDWAKIYDGYHYRSKTIQLTDDNTLYLATMGGGLLQLSGLSNLYVSTPDPGLDPNPNPAPDPGPNPNPGNNPPNTQPGAGNTNSLPLSGPLAETLPWLAMAICVATIITITWISISEIRQKTV